jgi:hypothetical protein
MDCSPAKHTARDECSKQAMPHAMTLGCQRPSASALQKLPHGVLFLQKCFLPWVIGKSQCPSRNSRGILHRATSVLPAPLFFLQSRRALRVHFGDRAPHILEASICMSLSHRLSLSRSVSHAHVSHSQRKRQRLTSVAQTDTSGQKIPYCVTQYHSKQSTSR